MNDTGYPAPDNVVACPYCGNALQPGRWHSCKELHDSGDGTRLVMERLRYATLPRVSNLALIVIAVLIASYLGAHLLIAAGVPCPS